MRGETQDYNLDSYDRRFLKLNAAQKRQIQRDRRRKKKGLIRTDAMDRAERKRKHKQAQNDPKRNDQRKDPNEPGMGDSQFIRKREKQRKRECDKNPGGWACGWNAIDLDPYLHGGLDFDKVHWKHYPNEPPEEDSWYD